MHELSITRSIVAIVEEHAQGQRVKRVTVEIGQLSGIVPEAVSFCFDLVAAGTPVAGAELDIVTVPGLARCRRCHDSVALEALIGQCACGSTDLEQVQGGELRVIELEVDDVHELRV